MLNIEKYKDEFTKEIKLNDFAVNKKTREITECNSFDCHDCVFSRNYLKLATQKDCNGLHKNIKKNQS